MAFDCEIFLSDGNIYIYNTEDDGNKRSYERICAYLVSNDNNEVPKLYEAISEKGYTDNLGTLFIHVSSNDNMAFRKALVENGLKYGFKTIHLFNDNDLCFLNAIINVKRELIEGDIVCIFTRKSILHQMCCHIWEIGYRRAIYKDELKIENLIKEHIENILKKYLKKLYQKPIILASCEAKKPLENIFDELISYSRTYTPGNITKSWNRIPIEMHLQKSILVEIDGRQIIKFLPQSHIPAKHHVELFKSTNGILNVFQDDQHIVKEKFLKGNIILTCNVDIYGIFSYEIIRDFHILLLTDDEIYLYDLEQTGPVMCLDRSYGTLEERLKIIKQSAKNDNFHMVLASLPGIQPHINTNWYHLDSIGVLLLGYQKKYQSKRGEYYIALYGIKAYIYAVNNGWVQLIIEDSARLESPNYNMLSSGPQTRVRRRKRDTTTGSHIFNLQIENLLPNRTHETDTPTKITIFNFECEDLRHEYTVTDSTNYNIVESDPKEYKDLLLDGFLDAKAVQLFPDNAILRDISRLWDTKYWSTFE